VTLPDEVLEDVVEAAGEADSAPDAEVAAQLDHLKTLRHADECDRWGYDSEVASAHVFCDVLGTHISAAGAIPSSGQVVTYPVDRKGVPLAFTVDDQERETEFSLSTSLSAEQAEALAVDLLEQAHAARAERQEAAADQGGTHD